MFIGKAHDRNLQHRLHHVSESSLLQRFGDDQWAVVRQYTAESVGFQVWDQLTLSIRNEIEDMAIEIYVYRRSR